MFHNQDMLDVWMMYASIPGRAEIIEYRWTKDEAQGLKDELLIFGEAKPEEVYVQKVTKPTYALHL